MNANDKDTWPSRDSKDDARGLPGYPHGSAGERERDDRTGPAGGGRGFDPDSPDVKDPQIDPPGPAKIPDAKGDPQRERRAPGEQYPPYDKP